MLAQRKSSVFIYMICRCCVYPKHTLGRNVFLTYFALNFVLFPYYNYLPLNYFSLSSIWNLVRIHVGVSLILGICIYMHKSYANYVHIYQMLIMCCHGHCAKHFILSPHFIGITILGRRHYNLHFINVETEA